MPMSVTFIAVTAIVTSYAMLAYVIGTIANVRRRRAELAAEVQNKLLDRFGAAPELIEFLQSPAGHEFVNGFHNAPRYAAREKMLGGMRRGIVLAAIGLGFLFLFMADRQNDWAMYPGFLLLTLGVGFFVSTWWSMRLSREWGLIEPKRDEALQVTTQD